MHQANKHCSSWGQHGTHLGPVGPRWTPCWPHEPCCQGTYTLGCCEVSLVSAAAKNDDSDTHVSPFEVLGNACQVILITIKRVAFIKRSIFDNVIQWIMTNLFTVFLFSVEILLCHVINLLEIIVSARAAPWCHGNPKWTTSYTRISVDKINRTSQLQWFEIYSDT